MLSLTFLGTGAAVPSLERNTSSIALHREGELILFDCGEGTQRQMMRFSTGFSLREIYFTHYHGDHFLGLTGLIRTLGIHARTDPVTLYGPRGAERILGAAVNLGIEKNKFPIEIVELKAGDAVPHGDYDIVAFEADHRADTVGYALVEQNRLGRFDPDKARAIGIPEGPLWGRIHRGQPVEVDGRVIDPADLVGPARPGRKVVYTGDTRPHAAVAAAARGADVLVHEATFTDDERQWARETGHSTARQAAEIAREAGVRQLVLTHISSRYSYDASGLLAEAREVFPETVVARDGMVLEVPFRDEWEVRGEG